MSKARAKKKQRQRSRGGASATTTPRRSRGDRQASPRPSRFEVRDGVARPRPIWAPFPLTEIGTAVGLVIFAVGFEDDGPRSTWLMGVGAAVLVVVIGEQCLREHLGGFRSHTLLLAVLPPMVLHALVFFAIADGWRGPPTVAFDVAIAAALGWWLRRRFRIAHDRAVGVP